MLFTVSWAMSQTEIKVAVLISPYWYPAVSSCVFSHPSFSVISSQCAAVKIRRAKCISGFSQVLDVTMEHKTGCK